MEKVAEYIKNRVHQLYWQENMNCTRTTLCCLSELFRITLETQTLDSALGLHGAGGYRAQCGLVEGGLMFISIYGKNVGLSEQEIVQACFLYGEAFETKFGSLRCRELRPSGFCETDPPHMCEGLTCVAIAFTYQFILELETDTSATVSDLSVDDPMEEGQALVAEVKGILKEQGYRFDLTSKMQLKSECKEIEKYIKLIAKGKAREKDVKQLRVLILRLRTTKDGVMQFFDR